MNLLANSLTANLPLFAQAEEGGTAGVILFLLAVIVAVAMNIGKDKAVSAVVKKAVRVTDPNWGVMFGMFIFALLLGVLPNVFNAISTDAISENAVGGFRMAGLLTAIFCGLYLVFRAFCESSKVREPDQAWRLAVVASATIIGALYIGAKHGDDQYVTEKFKLGVDLAGGVNLVYAIEMEQDEDGGEAVQMNEQDMQGLLSALGRRLNPSGALDLILRPYGNNTHVEIVVPNATDEEIRQLKEIITNTGALEFLIQIGAKDPDHESVRSRMDATFAATVNSELVKDDQGQTIGRWVRVGKDQNGDFEYNASSGGSIKRVFYHEDGDEEIEVKTPVLIWNDLHNHLSADNPAHVAIEQAFNDIAGNATDKEFSDRMKLANVSRIEVLMQQPSEQETVSGEDLKTVRTSFDENLNPSVDFTMKAGSSSKFGRFTAQNVEKQLSIVLDGNLLSSANINSRISEHGTITGDFTQAEVDSIVGVLRAGALPSTLNPLPESENKMGASLGTATIAKGQLAISISLAVVLVFMIGWYFGVPGIVAAFALILNLILILSVMVMIGASFTLSGMAGLVLTVGMAVDANVLIFERIREELADGARIKAAIRNGFSRATITIIDANLTTLITAILLYAIGTDQIRGFAITLILGIIMSMFTAIYASRGLFAIAAGMKMISENSWCLKQGWLNRINVHFMSKTKLRIAAFISLIIITSGLVLTVNRKSEMLAIDLSGGTSAIFTMDDQTAAGIEQEIKANGFELEGGQELQLNITSVDLGDDSDDAWRVNTNIEDQNELASLLKDVFGDKLPTQSLSVTVVANSADPAVEDSSAVERIMPQFVAYQEEEPATEETTETKEPATDEEAAAEKPETVEEASTETEKPATAETEEATVTGPKTPEQNDSTIGNSNDEFNTQDNQENAVEVNSVTLKLELVVGGTEVNLKPSEVEGMIDAAVTTAGVERKTTVGEEGGRVTVYDIDDEELRKLTDELAKSDGTPYFEETQKFGAQIAGDMTSLGTMAIVFSFVGIITYIWLRFQHVSFGIAAVVALVHDVLVTLAAIALSKYFSGFLLLEDFKISLPVIAAFLTIIGYSLNDTIVVFDRVREVRGKNREITAEMLNKSVNSTLSRTLLTSLTTLFVVTTLYIGGGSGIHSFAFALVIGVVVGTYSSIFVASPTLLWLNNRSK